jgi:hypothetical protein
VEHLPAACLPVGRAGRLRRAGTEKNSLELVCLEDYFSTNELERCNLKRTRRNKKWIKDKSKIRKINVIGPL